MKIRAALGAACATLSLASGFSIPVHAKDFDVTGRVFDADTNAPIRGAIVVAKIHRWSSLMHGNIDNAVACFAVQVDGDGKFVIPASNWVNYGNNDSQGVQLVPYHRDFMLSTNVVGEHSFSRTPLIGRLMPNTDHVDLPVRAFRERGNQLRWFYKVIMPIDLLDCRNASVFGKPLLWQALHQEAEEFTAAQGNVPVRGQPQTVIDYLKRVTGTITEQGHRVLPTSFKRVWQPRYSCSIPGLERPTTPIPIPLRVGPIEQSRAGNDLVIWVPFTVACLTGNRAALMSMPREPLAEQDGQSLHLSWTWDVEPPNESLHGCECSQVLEFRVPGVPNDNLVITASPRRSDEGPSRPSGK